MPAGRRILEFLNRHSFRIHHSLRMAPREWQAKFPSPHSSEEIESDAVAQSPLLCSTTRAPTRAAPSGTSTSDR